MTCNTRERMRQGIQQGRPFSTVAKFPHIGCLNLDYVTSIHPAALQGGDQLASCTL